MTTEAEEITDLYEFDRERHEFKINNRVVLSVTQILRHAGLVRFYCDRRTLETARRRGTDVHMIVADIDRQPDSPASSRAYWEGGELDGYGRAWLAFKKEFGFVATSIEQRIFNQLHQFAGIYDKLGFLWAGSARERMALIEIKTGSPASWHGEQMAGYATTLQLGGALKGVPIDRLAVYLRPTGKFTVKEYKNPLDFSHFLAALAIARLRHDRGLVRDDIGFDDIFTGEYEPTILKGWQ